ncbi:acid phosphatase [Diplogelasinospora grovesii]|uniref:Acid phosphatase n=1 Tax=Diplogelasinospora grovesii TaxID=303347 RepID=A0AAN6S1V2_9PEZI|nr:acid phosphatase [Diplogelasinospora grovesii]
MRYCSILATFAALHQIAQGLNILITNDDGFGSANTRELYKQMTALGHDCYVVAPATDQSDMGGRVDFTSSATLTTNSGWDIIKAGAPAIGNDPNDSHIFYYNGTPAAQVMVALDYVLPTFANFSTPDLVLTGPNFGWNLGPFMYTLSGTVGAAYAAVERGIPAIAFSSGNSDQTPYYWVNASTKAGLQDPATITARLAANLAQALIKNAAGSRVLPLGYGITVNMPYITSHTSNQCINPPFVLTRMTGDAVIEKAVYDPKTKVFSYSNINAGGANKCINGDCSLPSETDVMNTGCMSSVTFFTVDYDAPYRATCDNATDVTTIIPIVVQLNGTTPPPGSGPNTTVVGQPPSMPSTSSPPRVTAIASSGVVVEWSLSALLFGLGIAVFSL